MDLSYLTRTNLRLPGYDYSQPGIYFITTNTRDWVRWFGNVTVGSNGEDPRMELSEYGAIIDTVWRGLPARFTGIRLYESVVMPDHFHGLIEIVESKGKTLSDMVGAFKSLTTIAFYEAYEAHHKYGQIGKLWQQDFWDVIIHGKAEFENKRAYIRNNPKKWFEMGKG